MSSSGINLECQIPLEEIIPATKHFSSETNVGESGFGMVYRGQLSEQWKHRLVAIKHLHPNSRQKNWFYHTKGLSGTTCCPFAFSFFANEKIVVYEYATNGSLNYQLQDQNKRCCLTWEQRLKICLRAARGIKYLHSGVGEHKRVIHRDVKSANILLDDNMEAKICDFGFSRFCPRNQPNTHVRTRVHGTRFYMDPSYIERGMLSKESDIYSFGVVMFEMSSGMMAYPARPFEETKDQKYLIDIVRSYYDDELKHVSEHDKLIDTDIKGKICMSYFHKFNEIAHMCINFNIKKRPTMDKIIEAIEEAQSIQEKWKNFYMWDKLSIPIDKQESGKNFYMVGPNDLSITWHETAAYWELRHIPQSRFPEVWILRKVCWLEIHGKITVVRLLENSTYVAYLIFQTAENCRGLDVPANSSITFGGKNMETENVYLQRPKDSKTWQENYVVPHKRKDGWMEIKLGEFKYKKGDDGEIDITFEEIINGNWKLGLIVEGIEIRLK